MHEVLVNRLGGLSLPRKSVVRLTDRPDMTLDVYHGRKNNNATTTLQTEILSAETSDFLKQIIFLKSFSSVFNIFNNIYHAYIHVISPDFIGSSRFGAFSHGLTLGRRNLPTRGFPMFFFPTVFLSEHFIVYGNNLPGGKVSDH